MIFAYFSAVCDIIFREIIVFKSKIQFLELTLYKNKRVKKLKIFLFALVLLFLGSAYFMPKAESLDKKKQEIKTQKTAQRTADYKKYAEEALLYCKKNKISTDFFVLIDFSIHSGKKRMFIWDFKKGKITDSFLVSHGCGSQPTARDYSKEKPAFSNQPNSHSSSLGKYWIGTKKVPSPSFGEKYLLYGKETTNNNALKRDIVIHPWSIIPDEEPYPSGVPESWGCPAVSPDVFKVLDEKFQSVGKNILLWAIYP